METQSETEGVVGIGANLENTKPQQEEKDIEDLPMLLQASTHAPRACAGGAVGSQQAAERRRRLHSTVWLDACLGSADQTACLLEAPIVLRDSIHRHI